LLLDPYAVVAENIDTRLIHRSDGQWRIPNPVNPGDNFAERWNDPGSHRAEAFFQWVGRVRRDLEAWLEVRDAAEIRVLLVPPFGKRVVEAAIPARHNTGTTRRRHAPVRISNPSKPWGTNVH